ncbi:elongation factor Tu GTP-binding domain protein (macronuclear) [Tetrahymena thermophila SB210]|uniref:Elongation factor Tu GTP-binding domain protein n=1 Tax=Tetrahymena thermophila (strain SB210) TaxID=312017 RepID=Q24BY4_TETTS|nr:elongation factor Tu GTP-binding domain protein [Tetrahymena thermophila SB210]EAS05318.2 elongation factor Tu GTP-binding domain protein [Tetrahymena thermophila SB210]|eukprot:XP_001025563.2 elongation factor Tu GTP-binding domain protein [Tetrahymena thermophila SB210]
MIRQIYQKSIKLQNSLYKQSFFNGQKPEKCFSNNIKDRIKKERMERLKRESIYFPTGTSNDLEKIRNIGIIAHIDAGKTTTTERMLYYAGALVEPGEVHDGNTVMDYLQQERDRGITIRAAAISFNWNNYQFNLIDTPGHIDFTGEVERSLRVLDGAVAIFDGVSGVQTQSEMVWLQSNKFNIPRLAFINKMDRNGSNLDSTLQSIQDRLNIDPLILQVPIGDSDQFKGVVDLIHMKKIIWLDQMGNTVDISPISKSDMKLYDQAHIYREKLLETISLYDEELGERILENQESVNEQELEMSIKKILQKYPKDTSAVLLGSSLKNKGIQPLMDSIIKYLPSPVEKTPVFNIDNPSQIRKPLPNEKLSAYVYKVINDVQKGPLTYVRVYSGTLQNRQGLQISESSIQEKPQQLWRVRADNYVQINEIAAGDIAAISGLKYTKSGDTLVDSKDNERFILEQLQMPQPVFMASLEYNSLKDKPLIDQALQVICREDNSLLVKDDNETGQIIVQGLGELHLEILRDRLETEFNLPTKLGKMRVTYRESISEPYEITYTFEKMMKGKPAYFELNLKVEPIEVEDAQTMKDSQKVKDKLNKQEEFLKEHNNQIIFGFKRDPEFDGFYREFKKRIQQKQSNKKGERDIEETVEVQKEESKTFTEIQLEKLRFIKNPEKLTEVDKLQDDFGEEILYSLSGIDFDLFYALEQTIYNGLQSGSILGYPLINCRVTILGGKFSLKRTTEVVVQMCTGELMQELIENSSPQLLEPVMDVEISTPTEFSREIINDISSNKRGRIGEMVEEKSRFGSMSPNRTTINAIVPLSETVGYTTFLRSISKGEASFLMKFKNFEFVGGQKQKEIVEGDF